MLTQEEDVEIHALAKQGWTISEIARHTGRDRKTIRLTQADLDKAGHSLNGRPRQTLDGMSPSDKLAEVLL